MAEKNQSANIAVAEPELSQLRALIEERSGIVFDESPEHDFAARVRGHMAAKKLTHAPGLLRLVRDSNLEYDELLEYLLAYPTWFLRSASNFAVLEKKVLSEMHQRKFWENPRSLRVWSAGCATGEEPYSIAMTISDSLEFAGAWNIHILATDISRAALEQAERGLYPLHSLGGLTARQKETYFTRANDQYLVRPSIRNMVSFAQMNLSQAVYMGRFDIIFCIDVLIYFDEARRSALIHRFHEYLESGGYLFVGSGEPAARAADKFEVSTHGDCTLYRKPIAPKTDRSVPRIGSRNGKTEREKKA